MTSRALFVDTHCHLDAARFDPDRDEVLARAWDAGVCGIVIPAVGPRDWNALLEWPAKDPRLQIGLGIHPQLLPEIDEREDDLHLERLDALLARNVACAVGECGLDGPSIPGAPLERQLRVLRRHLELAVKHDLPVLMHCLRAHPALVALFCDPTVPLPRRGVLMHSYSGGVDFAKFYVQRGCYFSFAGPVTFQEARKPIAALRAIPLDRLLVETDAPDQAPHPFRGARSEPAYVAHVAAGMAAALGIDLETLARRTTETARSLFQRPFGTDSL
ncbi:MAG: TatD family hydrolase [Myxococcaceae bacterium]|nr:TatD family hydrolase [Myxococcaceae bacterium]